MAAKRFLGLDGLRGICAVTVLLYHCSNFFFAGPTLQHGYLAVDVFFIMSGFVIALNYEQKLDRVGGMISFLRSRAHRLFPTYWLGCVLNLAVFSAIAIFGTLFSGDSWWMVWLFIPVATLVMLPDYITPDGTLYPGMEGVTWSLFLEWIAYILYASAAFRWKTSVLLGVCVFGWSAMAFAGFHIGDGWSAGGTRTTLFNAGLLRCIPAFAAGVVLYRIHRQKLFLRIPVIPTEMLLLAWVVIAAFPAGKAAPTMDAIIVPLLCPALVAMLIRSEQTSRSYCKILGDISYPLYVAHPGIVLLAHYTTLFGQVGPAHPVNGLFVVVIGIAAAWLIMRAAGLIARILVPTRSVAAMQPQPGYG